MSNPRIGRAAADRAAQRPNTEALDDNPVRGEVALTDGERTALQQEKETLLQRLGFPRSAPVETVGEIEQERDTVVETAAVSTETATEVVGELADHTTPQEIQRRIDEEIARSEEARIANEQAHKARLAELIRQKGEVEIREAKAFDAGTKARLTAAVTAFHNSNERAAAADSTAAAVQVNEQQEQWRQKVAPALAKAREIKRELRAFEREFGGTLDMVSRIGRAELLSGLPMTGRHVTHSLGLVNGLERLVHDTRDLLNNGLQTIDRCTREIETIIESPHRWSGTLNSRGVRNQETEAAINQALFEIVMPNESPAVLLAMMKSITGHLNAIREQREKFAGTPEATEPPTTIPRNEMMTREPNAAERAERGLPLPGRAVTAIDLFNDGRRTE